MKMAAGNIKKLTMELGGKSPIIIFPDADCEYKYPFICYQYVELPLEMNLIFLQLYLNSVLFEHLIGKNALCSIMGLRMAWPIKQSDQWTICYRKFSRVIKTYLLVR